jgi:cyclohexa-1,5-dienecarbonyl-CoA hydratase
MHANATFSRIVLDLRSPVARLTLRNPPLNVIDIPMMEELSHALAEVESRADISAIVFEGTGPDFSAGVDIAAHTPDKIHVMLASFHAVVNAIVNSRKVTLANVRGRCLGGGAELAMVCDIVVTSETAVWGFPEIKLACYPPVAVTALAALVGQKHAAEFILTGRTVTGAEAAQIGLANRALADDQVKSASEGIIDRLRKLSPAALSITKKAMYVWNAAHFDKGLARAEKIYFEDLMATEDAQEGINAFLEKRQPAWRGN